MVSQFKSSMITVHNGRKNGGSFPYRNLQHFCQPNLRKFQIKNNDENEGLFLKKKKNKMKDYLVLTTINLTIHIKNIELI